MESIMLYHIHYLNDSVKDENIKTKKYEKEKIQNKDVNQSYPITFP